MKDSPVNYLLSDQFARLEAARAYVQAAAELLHEALRYENRSAEVTYLRSALANSSMELLAQSAILTQTMVSMETNLAIENGQKETIYPPVPLPAAVSLELQSKQLELFDIDVAMEDWEG